MSPPRSTAAIHSAAAPAVPVAGEIPGNEKHADQTAYPTPGRMCQPDVDPAFSLRFENVCRDVRTGYGQR